MEDVGLSFTWRGKRYFLEPQWKPSGAPFKPLLHCPGCGKPMSVGHLVTPGPYGVTLSYPGGPESCQCTHGCGWHVHIRNGVATDC